MCEKFHIMLTSVSSSKHCRHKQEHFSQFCCTSTTDYGLFVT